MWEMWENFPSTTFVLFIICFVRLKCWSAGSVGRSLAVPLDWPMQLSGCLKCAELWICHRVRSVTHVWSDKHRFHRISLPFVTFHLRQPRVAQRPGVWKASRRRITSALVEMKARPDDWQVLGETLAERGGRGWLSGNELQITEIFSDPLSAFRALTAQLKNPNAGRSQQMKGSEFLNECKWKWNYFIYCQHEEVQSCDCYSDAAASAVKRFTFTWTSDPRVYYKF